MTNRKCGTCRFYEVSTLQTHGWCRNPAYPRRDELALLRESELGCRGGWGKDFWEAGSEGAESPAPRPAPLAPTGEAAATPVGVGLATLIPAEIDSAASGSTVPAGRRRPGSQPSSTPAPNQDIVVGFDPRLGSHPELGENGVPLPRTRRSAVAEAHKRALERRDAERAMSGERRTTFAPRPAPPPAGGILPPHQAGELSIQPSLAQPPLVPQAPSPAEPGAYPPVPDHAPVPRAHLEEGPAAVERPAMPEARPAPPLPVTPEALPPAGGSRAAGPPPPAAAVTGPMVPPAETRYWDQPGTANRFTRMRPPSDELTPLERPTPVETPRPASPTQRSEPPPPPSESPEVAQPVQQIGRPRLEPPLPAPAPRVERPARTIRPAPPSEAELGRGVEGTALEREERPQFPRNGRSGSATPATPAGGGPRPEGNRPPPVVSPAAAEGRPVVVPRPVDQALLRQLEAEWREQALQTQAGRRCGTCRYFRSPSGVPDGTGGGGAPGVCGCQVAGTYRQPVATQELGCLNALGSWWVASDEGWLQKAESRRPRRATPLLDALEREMSEREELVPERRRSAR